jgi:hypothetical protein
VAGAVRGIACASEPHGYRSAVRCRDNPELTPPIGFVSYRQRRIIPNGVHQLPSLTSNPQSVQSREFSSIERRWRAFDLKESRSAARLSPRSK